MFCRVLRQVFNGHLQNRNGSLVTLLASDFSILVFMCSYNVWPTQMNTHVQEFIYKTYLSFECYLLHCCIHFCKTIYNTAKKAKAHRTEKLS